MSVRYADITFRPIDLWPGEQTGWRRSSPFNAPWGATIRLLERELSMLDARNVVFQVALGESDLRLDGKPKAGRKATHPGVILAFDSKYGPLKYAVDTYTSWDDNVRAIALAMEALRKVDRYGVTKRGEQYTGWKAIPASTDVAASIVTEAQALEVAGRWMVPGEDDVRSALRKAVKETHPDRGGDPDDFRRVVKAKEILGV